MSYGQLRDLDTSTLTTAADTAATVGKDMVTRADDIVDAAKNGPGSWEGLDADAQNALMNTFPPPLNAAGSVFKSAAGTIDALVTELNAAKSDAETAVASYPRLIVGDDGSVTYPPTNNAQDAAQLKTQARELAAALRAAVERANTADESASSRLATNDVGAAKTPVQVKLPDGSVYIATGDGDNKVTITNDAKGNVVATIDGKTYTFAPGTGLVVNSGGGNDEVNINKSVSSGVTLNTGDGEDIVTDHESTGQRTFVTGEGADVVATTGNDRNVFTGGGDDEVTAIGDKNNVAVSDGDDTVNTTGGTVFGGDGDDTIRAGNHDSPLYRDKPEHSTTVFGGAGDDEIEGSDKKDIIVAGSGDDEVYGHGGDDNVYGQDGNDYIDGQDGDDLVYGGDDKDTIYGLDGEDDMHGGSGDDYLEGGTGKDTIAGDAGNDVVSGGRDGDFLQGGTGDDAVYAGHGQDIVDGGTGADKAFVQDEDTVFEDKSDHVQKVEVKDTGFIKVEGSEEFQDRVRADLDMYGSSPTGHHMIDNLRGHVEESQNDGWFRPGEDSITITEYDQDNGSAHQYPWIIGDRSVPSPDEILNDNPKIQVNPEFHLDKPAPHDGVPSTVLYHELSHAYDYLNSGFDDRGYTDNDDPDSGWNKDEGKWEAVPNGERAAAGLPVDHDGDPATDPIQDPDQPFAVTENGLRAEMGLPKRTHYGYPNQPG